MKKIKKIMAMLLAMVMVLGMTVTAMAAPNSAKITVNNLDKDATIESVQVIAPDTSKPTGWTFVNGAETAYATAFGYASATEEDLQNIIWKLILKQNPNAEVPEGTVAATTEQIQTALENVVNYSTSNVQSNFITVNQAGVYAIKATTTNTTVYVYSPMAAYVAFTNYNTETGAPESLQDVTVNAKRTTLSVEKDSDEKDNVVEVGKEVEYTITTTVPYIKDNVAKVTYTLKDSIEGATYNTVNGKLDAVVTLGNKEYPGIEFEIAKDGKSFTADLSKIAEDRTNANKELRITYKATVTGLVVNNKVEMGDGTHTPWTNEDVLYTGSITMTKTGEEKELLANAGFKVYRKSDGKFAVATKVEGKDEYEVTAWTDKEEEATMMLTGTKGTFVVKGLDDSETYKFKEVQAPEGYSINTEDSTAKWEAESPENNKVGNASMADTKLSSLPSTGGIGTTIFTIGGCAIMIAAAGLFFASRRKANK